MRPFAKFSGEVAGVLTPKLVAQATLAVPSGAGGGQLNVTLLDLSASFVGPGGTPPRFVFEAGYYTTAGVSSAVLLDTRDNPSSDLQQAVPGNTLSFTVPDLIQARFQWAPVSRETWPEQPQAEEGYLIDFLRWVYGEKLGFSLVDTNLPILRIPRVDVEPSQSYHDIAQSVLAIFEPLVLTNAAQQSVLIFDPDTGYTNAPIRLKLKRLTVETISEVPYPIINQVEGKWSPSRHGGADTTDETIRGGCSPLLSQVPAAVLAQPGGDRVLLTLDMCGGFVLGPDTILEGEVEEVEDTIMMPLPGGGLAQTVNKYAVWHDDPNDRSKPTRSELVGSIVRTWAVGGEFSGELVQEVETERYYLPGSNLQVSTGHKTTTRGIVRIPTVGPMFHNEVSVETEWICYEKRENDPNGTWREVGKTRTVTGLVLQPDKVALSTASLNDTVDTSRSSGQHAESDIISQHIEVPTKAGNGQLQTTIMDYSIQRGHWEVSTVEGGQGDTKVSAGNPEPISKIFTDQSLINTYHARKRVAADATSYGSSGSFLAEWKANRYFQRSGKTRRQVRITVEAPLTRLYRGAYVQTEGRTGDVTGTYLVLGWSLTFANLTPNGKATAVTTIDALELNTI